jgi:transcriptional regulator with XRE-family HTH domain
MSEINKKLGAEIKKYRKLSGLTQSELAGYIGKTERTIRRYENDSVEIPLSVLELIATVLDIGFTINVMPRVGGQI